MYLRALLLLALCMCIFSLSPSKATADTRFSKQTSGVASGIIQLWLYKRTNIIKIHLKVYVYFEAEVISIVSSTVS